MSFGTHVYALLVGHDVVVLACESVDLVISVQNCCCKNVSLVDFTDI